MGKRINVKIIMRYNTTDGWSSVKDPSIVLEKGEIGLEYTSNTVAAPKMKIGDGNRTWNALPYFETALPSKYTWGDLKGTNSKIEGTTTNILELEKPGFTDVVNIVNLNKNLDKIDDAYSLHSSELNSLGERITKLAAYAGEKWDEGTFESEIIDARTRFLEEHDEEENLIEYLSLGECLRAIDKDLQTFKGKLDNLIGGSLPSGLRIDEETGNLFLMDKNGDDIGEGIQVKDMALSEEVEDIRVRNNGETFDLAGNAVRAIDKELQDIRKRANESIFNTAGEAVRAIDKDVQDLKTQVTELIDTKIPDGLSYVDNMLALTVGGEIIGDPVKVVGGGGGGTTSAYNITLTNLLDSRTIIVAEGSSVILKYKYISVDNEGMDDGSGNGELYVDNVKQISFSVSQGENEIDITSYLSTGESSVRLKITNSEGSYRTILYTVSILSLSVTSNMAEMGYYNNDVLDIQYTVSGEGTKTVYFHLIEQLTGNSTLLHKEELTSSGQSRQYTMTRPENEGTYILQIYAVSGEAKSNTINLGMIWYSDSSTNPFILINTTQTTAQEGEIIKIPYLIYFPNEENPQASFKIIQNGEIEDEQEYNVGRVAATWNIQKCPTGLVRFQIECGGKSAYVEMEITKSSFDKEIIANGLLFEFNAIDRNNSKANYDEWSYENYKASFSNVGWIEGVDGWFNENGEDQTCLRLLPGSEMFIPFEPFANNITTNGYTIELELATQNVSDYDSIVIESYSGSRGFLIKSQSALIQSSSTSTSVQFKEDERVRITFVVEQGTSNRLIYTYIDGVCCGVVQYPSGDIFSHPSTDIHGLTIGAETCGIDVYFIRFYNLAFTADQQLNNFICDRPTLAERIKKSQENNIVNENASDIYQSITLGTLGETVSYLIMECPQLPQYKGDKKDGMSVTYVDAENPERSFTAENCQFNVQGTSSAIYPVKNFKIKMKEGITYTQSGEKDSDGFRFLGDESLHTQVLCLKANYASSEQANNVCLVDYYNETCPYRTPAQEKEPRARYGVYGKPIVLFWRDTKTYKLYYQGLYCMNDDKDNPAVFGFEGANDSNFSPTEEEQEKIECWEFSNNNTSYCLFKASDKEWDELIEDGTDMVPNWSKSFERRYPEQEEVYEDNNTDKLKRVVEWVISTDPDAVSDEEEQEARLKKFKNEFENYFILDAMSYYYVYTEVFLLMDSRAKNLFLTTYDGIHWMPFPYDMDSAIGINNEGSLTFDYNLEDTDTPNGSDVFTGQSSVLWNNFRECFSNEIAEMYKKLRSQDGDTNGSKPFSYEAINEKMTKHQEAWPEVLWNKDTEIKYLQPFYAGKNYLDMAQGNKSSQRDFWLYNAFKYRDSKYQTGDAATNYIALRLYSAGEGDDIGTIEITPYSHIYARVQFGNAKNTIQRVSRNETAKFDMLGITEAGDLETHIYSADCIAKLGDLSALKIGLCELGNATKLQQLIIGSEKEGYTNEKFETLSVGNNELLEYIDVSNCVNLKRAIKLSKCYCLKTLKAYNTQIPSADFSIGGRLEDFYLPSTITSLKLRKQINLKENGVNIQTDESGNYSGLITLFIDNTPNVPLIDIIKKSPNLEYVRLTNFNLETTIEELEYLYERLTKEGVHGITEDGKSDTSISPVVSGKAFITVEDDTYDLEEFLNKMNEAFPNLIITINGEAQFYIKYVNYKNEVLYSYIVKSGEDAIDPIESGKIDEDKVYRQSDTDEDGDITTEYSYVGWYSVSGGLPTNIQRSYTIYPIYNIKYRVRFISEGEIFDRQMVEEGKIPTNPITISSYSPTKDPTAQYSYTFYKWDKELTETRTATDYYATFYENIQQYRIEVYAGEKQISSQEINYGDAAVLPDTSVVYNWYLIDDEYNYYEIYTCIGWEIDKKYGYEGENKGIYIKPEEYTTDIIVINAVFSAIIPTEYTWEQIVEFVRNGEYATKIPIGTQKDASFVYNGKSYTATFEVVAQKYDKYSDEENNAALTFLTKDIFLISSHSNDSGKTWNNFDNSTITAATAGGWTEGLGTAVSSNTQNLYENLNAIIFEDEILENNIRSVKKFIDFGPSIDTRAYYMPEDEAYLSNFVAEMRVWTPSAAELGILPTFNSDEGLEYQYGSECSKDGKPYPWFTTNDSRIKNYGSVSTSYFTRTQYRGSPWRFCGVGEDGGSAMAGGTQGLRTFDTCGLVFGFCL